MDDNTKEVLVLLITTFSTVVVAWMRMRHVQRNPNVQTVPPPAAPTSPPPPDPPGV
jgi:hypothetical protein